MDENTESFPRLTRTLRHILPNLEILSTSTSTAEDDTRGNPEKMNKYKEDYFSGWARLINVIKTKKCLNESVLEKLKEIKASIDQFENKDCSPDPSLYIFGLMLNNEESMKKISLSLKDMFGNVTLRHVKDLSKLVHELFSMLTSKCRNQIHKFLKEENSETKLYYKDKLIYNVSWTQPDLSFLENLAQETFVDKFSMKLPETNVTIPKVNLFWLTNELKSNCAHLFKNEDFTIADCASFVVIDLASNQDDTLTQQNLLGLLGDENIALVNRIIRRKESFLQEDILLGAKRYASQRNAECNRLKAENDIISDEEEIFNDQLTKTVHHKGKEKEQWYNKASEDERILELVKRNTIRVGGKDIIKNRHFEKPPLSTGNSFAALESEMPLKGVEPRKPKSGKKPKVVKEEPNNNVLHEFTQDDLNPPYSVPSQNSGAPPTYSVPSQFAVPPPYSVPPPPFTYNPESINYPESTADYPESTADYPECTADNPKNTYFSENLGACYAPDELSLFGEMIANFLRLQNDSAKVEHLMLQISNIILSNCERE